MECEVKFYEETEFLTQLWVKNRLPKEDGLQEYLLPITIDMDMRSYKKDGLRCFVWNLDQKLRLYVF
jgi:hypothetical protein